MKKLRLLLGLVLATVLPLQLSANPALLPTIATYTNTALWLSSTYTSQGNAVEASYWNGSAAGMQQAASLIGQGFSTPAQFFAVAANVRAQANLFPGLPVSQAYFHGAADALESVGIWTVFPP